MTPAARYAAAIEILDEVLAGTPAEPACLAWTRGHRFAGSKDRAAIRDIVFSVERRRRSCAAMGGGLTGRGLIRGYLAQSDVDESTVLGADRYAPPLSEDDPALTAWADLGAEDKADLQPWMWRQLSDEYGEKAAPLAEALRHRAPVWLRVNSLKAEPAQVLSELTAAGFDPLQDEDVPTAIQVRKQSRQLAQHRLLKEGHAELQDLGPQRALARLDITPGMRVLDYCAGGGGKSLELAARGAEVTAHDANPKRMKDLPARAARAGAKIDIAGNLLSRKFDVVVCDVPCSGSGAFRRVTDGKWKLTPQDLASLVELQRTIALTARQYLAPGGQLIYMTCSLLATENNEQEAWLSAHLNHRYSHAFTPLDGCDGFFVAVFN